MRLPALALACLVLASPPGGPLAHAQQPYEPPLADQDADAGDGLGLIERGIGMIMRNFWNDVGPDLDRLGEDMSAALSRMGPLLEDMSVLVDDLRNYQAPERLENGDVIIRRKPGAPPPPPLGEGLRQFSVPRDEATPAVPRNPYAPEVEL